MNDNLKLSDKGIKLIIEVEGIENKKYLDPVGLPTIGIGHLLTKDELKNKFLIINNEKINYSNGLTDEQVYNLLKQDVKIFEDAIKKYVKIKLNQNQFDALVSFVYNIGPGNFKNSKLLQKLNLNLLDQIPNEFRKWSKSRGRILKGLKLRRDKEINLFNEPIINDDSSHTFYINN